MKIPVQVMINTIALMGWELCETHAWGPVGIKALRRPSGQLIYYSHQAAPAPHWVLHAIHGFDSTPWAPTGRSAALRRLYEYALTHRGQG